MKKLLIIGVVIITVVAISAGAVFAGPGDSSPSIMVKNFAEAITSGVRSCVNITNLSDIVNGTIANVTVTNVTVTVSWQEEGAGPDDWTELTQYVDVDEQVPVVLADEELELVYEIACTVPEDAVLLRSVADVQVEGTDEVFTGESYFLPLEDSGGDPPPVVDDGDDDEDTGGQKEAFRAGNSHCWHFMISKGASGRLNCQIKDGQLVKGVFNGKGLEAGVKYCLYYGDDCLGSGYANKGGKVHITVAGGDMGEEPSVAELHVDMCEEG